ncbi:hypothetical protein C4573_00280 [Candidatus Woesearchaeota archaeon]|nr:MAG: hypothetical protein C4573_00280 [Candidatus Woesearchaeota archaeon]
MKWFAVFIVLVLVAGCSLFEEEKEREIETQTPEEILWKPDTSNQVIVTGIVEDNEGFSLPNVQIVAEYTVNCDEKNCPYHEIVQTITNMRGEYQLNLYQHFWDVGFYKKTYSRQTLHIAQEDMIEETLQKDVVLNKGLFKSVQGYIRDQGTRMILDKGEGNFAVYIGGKTSYFRYLVITNDPESMLYKSLKAKNNQFATLEGYVALSGNTAELEVETVK